MFVSCPNMYNFHQHADKIITILSIINLKVQKEVKFQPVIDAVKPLFNLQWLFNLIYQE